MWMISINFSPELFDKLQVTFIKLVMIGEIQNIFVGSDIQWWGTSYPCVVIYKGGVIYHDAIVEDTSVPLSTVTMAGRSLMMMIPSATRVSGCRWLGCDSQCARTPACSSLAHELSVDSWQKVAPGVGVQFLIVGLLLHTLLPCCRLFAA